MGSRLGVRVGGLSLVGFKAWEMASEDVMRLPTYLLLLLLLIITHDTTFSTAASSSSSSL